MALNDIYQIKHGTTKTVTIGLNY